MLVHWQIKRTSSSSPCPCSCPCLRILYPCIFCLVPLSCFWCYLFTIRHPESHLMRSTGRTGRQGSSISHVTICIYGLRPYICFHHIYDIGYCPPLVRTGESISTLLSSLRCLQTSWLLLVVGVKVITDALY